MTNNEAIKINATKESNNHQQKIDLTNLKTEIESDVRGSAEQMVEEHALNSLKEIKNKLKLDDEYITTLYKAEFKTYLKSKSFENWNLAPEIIKINNIKLEIIKKWLEKNKEQLSDPNRVTRRILYPIWNISTDISNNGPTKNIIKGIIDELMAIPDMAIMILKNPKEFGMGLWEMIKNPGTMLKALKEAFTDAFTQGMATPEAQYRTGRSSTLIVLSLFPGGIGKSLFNVAKTSTRIATRATVKTAKKVVWKSTAESAKVISKGAKNMTKDLGKHTANKIEQQAIKQGEKATKKTIDQIQKWTLNKTPNTARRITKSAGELSKKWVENVGKFVNKAPVLKQINQFKNRSLHQVDNATTFMFKKTNPKLYDTFMKQQGKLSKLQQSVWQQVSKLEKAAEHVANAQTKIAALEAKIAANSTNKIISVWRAEINVLKKGWIRKWKNITGLNQYTKNMATVEKALLRANEALSVHNKIVQAVKNGKIANWVRIQQGVSILERTQYELIEKEIIQISEGIDESALEDFIDNIIELEDQLDGIDVQHTNFASWATEVWDISLNLPEEIDLETIDWENYTINIVGLSSKTGSRATNIAISKKRAENAKIALSNQYGIPEESFILSEKRQGDHPEHMDEDISKRQGVQVEVKLKEGNDISIEDAQGEIESDQISDIKFGQIDDIDPNIDISNWNQTLIA